MKAFKSSISYRYS